jgi:hypothetical protein
MIKKIPVSALPLLFSALGGVIFSQSVTFGWLRKGFSSDFSSHTQSVCLFLAGFGLLLLSYFVSHTLARMSSLEEELEQLRREQSAGRASSH